MYGKRCVVLGWAVFQVLERTIGKPLETIGRWLANMAAGVQLVIVCSDMVTNPVAVYRLRLQSVLLSSQQQEIHQAISQWQEGECALVLHVYGGIGGKKKEPAAQGSVYFGHFGYGLARVVREPLTSELRFDIQYHQVYTHNTEGLIAGTLAWGRYMGDRQWGWLGIRPVCDILIKLDAFTKDFDFDGKKRCALNRTIRQLEAMTARYRIGGGTGATYVGPANNCAQDANQALYASLKLLEIGIQSHADFLRDWRSRYPEQGRRFAQLVQLEKSLKRELVPL